MDTYRIYEKLSGSLGEEAAGTLATLLGDMFVEIQNTVTKSDFSELKAVVKDLADAQGRTEQRVEELAEAQKRTEQRVEELAQAQKELAEAQKRTELRVEELAESHKELAISQKAGFEAVFRRFDAMGSRWGDGAEGAFRQGLLEAVGRLGYTVTHYHGQDPDGFINHRPGRSFDLDILVHNGTVVAVEIKSSASGADVTEFHRSVRLYEQQSGRKVNTAILVAIGIQKRAIENAKDLGVIIATDLNVLDSLREAL